MSNKEATTSLMNSIALELSDIRLIGCRMRAFRMEDKSIYYRLKVYRRSPLSKDLWHPDYRYITSVRNGQCQRTQSTMAAYATDNGGVSNQQ